MKTLKRRILKYVILGLLSGSFVYLAFSIFLSLRLNTGKFHFVLPALVNNYDTEMTATIMQIAIFLWLGISCGIAFSITENVDWNISKQITGYISTLTIGVLPIGIAGDWHKHIFIGLFSYLLLLMFISLLLYIISWVKLKNDVLKIKHTIEQKKEELS